tara:strand:- start:639 stop:914 length:276 start_codon:yes stop_codon:yes gene_type:complete
MLVEIKVISVVRKLIGECMHINNEFRNESIYLNTSNINFIEEELRAVNRLIDTEGTWVFIDELTYTVRMQQNSGDFIIIDKESMALLKGVM